MEKDGLNHKRGPAMIGFRYGLPCWLISAWIGNHMPNSVGQNFLFIPKLLTVALSWFGNRYVISFLTL